MKRTLAFIPARGGSKGVVGKNLKNIHGKPLIAWTIEEAISSKLIDEVIVSTDDEDIAETSKKYGALVPFLRPKEISGDLASTESAMLHCCNYLAEKGEVFQNFVLLQCTSPVRMSGVLDCALEYFEEEKLDSLLSVAKSHRFTWRNMEQPTPTYNFLKRPRRQDIEKANTDYVETGSFYITKIKNLLESGNRLSGKIGMFETDVEESYEIDSELDFKICEAIMRNRKK